VKTWSDDNPKAALMERKRAAIVDAARQLFLAGGYAQTSMDRVAEKAEVAITTVYRHFNGKDDLFSAVMQMAVEMVAPELFANGNDADSATVFPWFTKPPQTGLRLAGIDYLTRVFDPQQMDLYRVVTRDAGDFPELGRRYLSETAARRNRLFVEYLNHWRRSEGWKIRDLGHAAEAFVALLRARLFDEAIHGGELPTQKAIALQAKRAASCLLVLLGSGCL
jgi:TetR/AcrR family transcriptional repressor of mexJK operon